MSRERWRFIDSGPATGAVNMAVDEALLEAHMAGETPPTLRVYSWRPPAVSLGHFQRAEKTVKPDACRELGIAVVRRPTGGRAILHTSDEITFSIITSAARLGARGVMDCYRRLAGGIIAALGLLGVEARLVERAGPSSKGAASRDPACFAVKARCDLVVGEHKLVGSAQVQRQGFLLQQNSLPFRVRFEEWDRVFLRPAVRPDAEGLCDAAGRDVTYEEAADALRRGFAECFRVELVPGDLTEREKRRAEELAPLARVL